ncbi:uncharacterized protein LOC143026312 [Oratosquilla oratoria]|uniref:uncharacterized protein LOC143026312 n=1 Tax=Oratosquilla oratoria TaxID=337810 RepID=UPI003F776AE2
MAKQSLNDIVKILGVRKRTIQRWKQKFRASREAATSTHTKRLRRDQKSSPHTVDFVKRQIDNNPYISTRELKKRIPHVLGSVSARTVWCRLHDDQGFCSCCDRMKLLTIDQQEEREQSYFLLQNGWGTVPHR